MKTIAGNIGWFFEQTLPHWLAKPIIRRQQRAHQSRVTTITMKPGLTITETPDKPPLPNPQDQRLWATYHQLIVRPAERFGQHFTPKGDQP